MTSSPPKKRLRGNCVDHVDKASCSSPDQDEGEIDVRTTGHCPNCQMPFAVLRVQTVAWHLAECLEIDRKDQRECSMGSDCDCTIVSHYLKFTHYRLAAHRSGVEITSAIFNVHDRQPNPPAITQQASELRRSSMALPKRCANGTGDAKQSKITSFFTSVISEQAASTLIDVAIAIKPDSQLDRRKVLRQPTQPLEVGRMHSSMRACDDQFQLNGLPAKPPCPKYKKIVDVPFVVDAFKYGDVPGITAYFLSHFHYDHYVGLTNKFRKKLFCSQVTANLVKLKFSGIPASCLHVLPLNERCLVNAVEVTLIEANHCPGAVMFLFRYTDGRTVLHTGDFRADVTMEQHPALSSSLNVDFLYLDTTYCEPIYDFPTQSEVLDFVVNAAKTHMRNDVGTLIVCGSYTIGKEKVFMAIANALKLKVWAPPTKRRTLECLEDHYLDHVLTNEVGQAGIHVLAMGELGFQYLEEYLSKASKRFNSVLAFRPTGWEHHRSGRNKNSSKQWAMPLPKKHGRVIMYGVPYSEHSSFSELRRFVQFVKPTTVIPTVNVTGDKSRQQMDIIRSWMRKMPFDSVK